MMRKKKALTILFSTVLCLQIFFSLFTIVIEANHDCLMEHCPACERLEVCISSLCTSSTHFRGRKPLTETHKHILPLSSLDSSLETTLLINQYNLVSLKVKLTN